jgi:hypothetical protein
MLILYSPSVRRLQFTVFGNPVLFDDGGYSPVLPGSQVFPAGLPIRLGHDPANPVRFHSVGIIKEKSEVGTNPEDIMMARKDFPGNPCATP